MTRSTSAVAFSRSSASSRSGESGAKSDCVLWFAADVLCRRRRFCVTVLRRRDLARSAPALHPRLIPLPWLNRAQHSGLSCFVHHSKARRNVFAALVKSTTSQQPDL